MKPNEIIRKQIFEIIKNQMKSNNPPETKETYIRLLEMGYGDLEAKKLIGRCVSVEIFDILKNKNVFDRARFVKNLKNLPAGPFD